MVSISKNVYKNNNCARTATRSFNEKHSYKPVNYKYNFKVMGKFREDYILFTIGDINPSKCLLLTFRFMENAQSVWKVSPVSRASVPAIFKIFHTHKFHPFKNSLEAWIRRRQIWWMPRILWKLNGMLTCISANTGVMFILTWCGKHTFLFEENFNG